VKYKNPQKNVINVMAQCKICGKSSQEISSTIGVCVDCIRKLGNSSLEYVKKSRKIWREHIGLPLEPPKALSDYVECRFCINRCRIPNGSQGFCGIIKNDGGTLTTIAGSFDHAFLHYYFDPHPTNCVAEFTCPATTSIGYPKYTKTIGIEYGYYNLAVFFAGCNLDCLFCQNIEHKYMIQHRIPNKRFGNIINVETFVKECMQQKITCICYFGGDPTPHSAFILKASRKILKEAQEAKVIKRICWETNGLEDPRIMREIGKIALDSGGIVKIDWKAYTPEVYEALTGVNGYEAIERIKENVKILVEMGQERPEVPLLVVSTLVVPHYVDAIEVEGIAKYLSYLNENIPYSLLAFYPQHLMKDLPRTSKKQMTECYRAAKMAGLKKIHVGNYWLLI